MEALSSSSEDLYFITCISEIERRYSTLNQYERTRVEQWCRKLGQAPNTTDARENRNLHAMLLLDQVLNGRLDTPFSLPGSELAMAKLSAEDVKGQLSDRFFECIESAPKETELSPDRTKKSSVKILRNNYIKVGSMLDTKSPNSGGRSYERSLENSLSPINPKSDKEILQQTLTHMQDELNVILFLVNRARRRYGSRRSRTCTSCTRSMRNWCGKTSSCRIRWRRCAKRARSNICRASSGRRLSIMTV
eukprot:TRINITY_DN3072_c0_g1_i9.p1 TRINITY_DN3072_c0_g1~~TRINITY_DN3072_c0_g1_i9.p1  ORF type:complete len:249 (+),score=35.07 TRINITY_DN3072_c0_g1_i9:144-890(+)